MVEIIRQNYRENYKKYQDEKRKIKKIIRRNYGIYHVGSTAIPGMYGKNIIDILIGAIDCQELKEISDKLSQNGYFTGQHGNKKYQFLASRDSVTKSGDVHIHIGIFNNKTFNNFLILKEYLLDNKEIKKAYSNYKKAIVKNYSKNRRKYRQVKSTYVSNLIMEARKYFLNQLPKELIFIRHAENIKNDKLPNDLLPLSDKGKNSALKAKDILNNQFDMIISSPSKRAMDTAKIINNKQIIIDSRLIEKGFGNKKNVGNETIGEAIVRFNSFLYDLKNYSNKRLLIVTHGSLMRLIQNIIEEKNSYRKHINNCDIIKYIRTIDGFEKIKN